MFDLCSPQVLAAVWYSCCIAWALDADANQGVCWPLLRTAVAPLVSGPAAEDRLTSPKENKEGLQLLKTAIEKAGYTGKVSIGMNVAASEFYGEKDQTYDLNFKEENNDGSQKISGDSLKNVYKSFVDEYPIFSIEDPFDQDDWVHYAKMTEEIGEQVQIVGDAVAQLALRRALAAACGRRRRGGDWRRGGIRPFRLSHLGRRG